METRRTPGKRGEGKDPQAQDGIPLPTAKYIFCRQWGAFDSNDGYNMVRLTFYKDILEVCLEAMKVQMNCKEGRNKLEGERQDQLITSPLPTVQMTNDIELN